jgi:site-specific DNA recombinase
MEKAEKKKINCAIYTRVSSSEGLEQEFTSLDNQRESAESYIQSQKSEGWMLLPERYDDGGYTGANTERPALQKLLTAIKDGNINCVVVYKVDRLSRSLLDFSRLLEFFEQNNVTFVSVTQAFNTNTSMGRLTLNILLSFAQFEREIISERTRDKMGAARKKGQWMGGRPALGYNLDKENHKIVINEAEAKVIREMFSLYIKERSLLSVAKILNEKGYRTKSYMLRKGKPSGNTPFKATNIQLTLRNMLYIGKINYKGKQVFQGQHKAIISEDTFNKAQAILNGNRREIKAIPRKNTGLLSQILRCKHCNSSMVYSYTKKKAYKYLYYFCLNAQKRGYADCPTKTIHALKIEKQVISCLREIATDKNLKPGAWEALPFAQQRSTILAIVKTIQFEAKSSRIWITLSKTGKSHEFKIDLETRVNHVPPIEETIKIEPKLRQHLILAYHIQELLSEGKAQDPKQIARWLNISNVRIYQILGMLFLSPRVQEEIIFSRNPILATTPEYKINELTQETDWKKQELVWKQLLNTHA